MTARAVFSNLFKNSFFSLTHMLKPPWWLPTVQEQRLKYLVCLFLFSSFILMLCSLLSSTLAFFWLLCNAVLPHAITTLDMPLPLPETHPPAISSVFPSLLLQSLLMSVKNLSNQTVCLLRCKWGPLVKRHVPLHFYSQCLCCAVSQF